MSEPIIRIEKVNKWFGQFHVLTDVDLDVRAGETIAFEIRNPGAVPHEFFIGTPEDQTHHEQEIGKFYTFEPKVPGPAYSKRLRQGHARGFGQRGQEGCFERARSDCHHAHADTREDLALHDRNTYRHQRDRLGS